MYYFFSHYYGVLTTGTCFIQKIYAPSSSLLQGKHLPFTPSSLRLNIFRLFVILSLTQSYRYTPEIFLFSTATFKYKYRRIGQEYSAKVEFSIFQALNETRACGFNLAETVVEKSVILLRIKMSRAFPRMLSNR